jgi:hypothetical protein
VRPVQADLLTEGAEHLDHRRQVVRQSVGQFRRDAEAREIDGCHLPLHGEQGQHRVPGLPVVTDAVEQEQRLAGAGPFIGHGHRPRPLW